VHLQLVRTTLPQHRRIAPRLGVVQDHRLLEELEAVDLLDRAPRRLDVVEHDERLALGPQVRLGHDVYNIAELGEDLLERQLHLVDLHPVVQVADLVASSRSVPTIYVCMYVNARQASKTWGEGSAGRGSLVGGIRT